MLVDTAGGETGGAKRFRDELDLFAARDGTRVIGRGQRITAKWMITREMLAARIRPSKVVATNNAAFITPRCESWVLLRNALNFLSQPECAQLGVRPRIDVESFVMRRIARRADVVVVPSSSMAMRVVSLRPELKARVVVRHHPVTPRNDDTSRRLPDAVACPVMFDRHKDMPRRITLLAAAADLLRKERPNLVVYVTATTQELQALGLDADSPLRGVGRLSPEKLAPLLSSVSVIFFPPTLESFGYPLAEARANGQRVVALGTEHNAEIAGHFLAPYQTEAIDSLAEALASAASSPLPSEPRNPFDPGDYFEWMLSSEM